MPKPDKKLFTPGPLGCTLSVKEAMLRDLGSRDKTFIKTISDVKKELLKIAGADEDNWTAVLLQGSGTYAVEAVIQTTSPRDGARVLVIANGAYGKRMQKICQVAGIECDIIMSSEVLPVDVEQVKSQLCSGVKYSTVAIVHCETSSGVMNDVEAVGHLVRLHQPMAHYFVDAMSSFGAVQLDLNNIDFVVSSANKCLQGVPGFSYAISRRTALNGCQGNCRSLSLDLFDQDKNMEKSGQFRFTPPTHTILAFNQALIEFYGEGGLQGREKRYKENRAVLKEGMARMGFKELVPEQHAGHIITCFFYPKHKNFSFETFYQKLSDLDQVIYPGKVTEAPCFRIGNIGDVNTQDMKHLLDCIKSVLGDMEIPIPVA